MFLQENGVLIVSGLSQETQSLRFFQILLAFKAWPSNKYPYDKWEK